MQITCPRPCDCYSHRALVANNVILISTTYTKNTTGTMAETIPSHFGYAE